MEFEKAIDLFTFVQLKNHLSDLLGVDVDFVTKKALKPKIGERILRETVYIWFHIMMIIYKAPPIVKQVRSDTGCLCATTNHLTKGGASIYSISAQAFLTARPPIQSVSFFCPS